MGLSNDSSDSNSLCTLQLIFWFRSCATPWGAITFPKSGHEFTNPDKNTQVRLAEFEELDERHLMAQQRLEIYQAQITGAI